MINVIYELLIESKRTYFELINKYSSFLPPKIIQGAESNYNSGLPNKINNLLIVLNSIEGFDKFQYVNDIDEAISLFSQNSEIQTSYEKCLTYSGSKKFTNTLGEEIEIKTIFESIKFGIKFDAESFGLLIITAKIASKEI